MSEKSFTPNSKTTKGCFREGWFIYQGFYEVQIRFFFFWGNF